MCKYHQNGGCVFQLGHVSLQVFSIPPRQKCFPCAPRLPAPCRSTNEKSASIRRPLRHIGGARQRSLPRRMERDGTLAEATCMILFRWACWARFLLLFGCFGTSQNGLSKLVPAMGRCGIRLVFLGRQYATLEIRGVALGRHVGHDSCCCSAVSEPANGLSKLVSARGRCGRSFVFLGRQYATLEIRGAALGRHVGHDSCCCSAVSEPANGLSKLVSARGRCGRSFAF